MARDDLRHLRGQIAQVTLRAGVANTAASEAILTADEALTTANEAVPAVDYTAADVLAKLLTVDGPGSGLNADLLDGASGADYLARANHTGSQTAATISDFDEAAQDAVGTILVDSAEIDFTYNDGTPSITAALVAGSIDETKLDASTNASLDLADSAVQPARAINTTAPLTGGGNLSGDRTIAISAATTGAAGSMSAADKIKADAQLAAVKYDAANGARGPTIADYFASTLSLEAASIYEITAHAYFLKTTAGTIVFTWLFSNAPTMATSRYQSTPVTGFTTSIITGAEVFAEATAEAVAALAHAASGSLTTAVRHSFMFTLLVRTNLATTLQLRCTESAGTVTPQAGSYMSARKII